MFHHDYQSALIKRGLSRVCTDMKDLIYRCQVLILIRPHFETSDLFRYEHINISESSLDTNSQSYATLTIFPRKESFI